MPSLTLLYGSATWISDAAEQGKDSYVYQFGDHDPTGVIIPRTIASRLDELCDNLGCDGPTVQRFALTEEHIAQYNLPARPTKRDGNTHAHGFDGDSVELDALPPNVLRGMVRGVIEQHISPANLEVLRVAEESERELIRGLATHIQTDV
jgi:hypothetical protein